MTELLGLPGTRKGQRRYTGFIMVSEAALSLVYLHGFASGPEGNKGRFCRDWAARHGVDFHAPDLNLPTFETLTVTAQVEAVLALLATLPESPVLVGSSLGGFVATAVAHRGAALHAMVLLAPAVHFARRRQQSAAWAEYRAQRRMVAFHFAANRMRMLGPALLEDLPHWLGDETWRIPVPARILHGRLDDLVPLAESEAYVQRNPEATLQVLDDDHGLLAPASLAALDAALLASFGLL
jgi:pimeloyl-ACP methyl ester carboxylesterase